MDDFLRKLATVFQPLFMAAALAVAAGGLGGPVMAVAETCSSSSEENLPVDERQEESTASFRIDHHRQQKFDDRRLAIMFEIPTSARLGHTQNIVLLAPSGHRLSNGLLAPLTC